MLRKWLRLVFCVALSLQEYQTLKSVKSSTKPTFTSDKNSDTWTLMTMRPNYKPKRNNITTLNIRNLTNNSSTSRQSC